MSPTSFKSPFSVYVHRRLQVFTSHLLDNDWLLLVLNPAGKSTCYSKMKGRHRENFPPIDECKNSHLVSNSEQKSIFPDV